MKNKTYNVKERYQGMTFAQASKKISDKYKDRDTNPMAKRSFMVEMEELVQLQELARAKEFAVTNTQQEQMLQQKFGGLMKYNLGGPFTPGGPIGPVLPPFKPPAVQTPPAGFPFNTPVGPPGDPTPPPPSNLKPPRKSSIYDPLIIGKGAELLGKSIMALSGTDKVQPEMNPYAGEVREQLANMRTDMGAVSQRLQGEASRGRTMASNLLSEPIRQAMYQNVASGAMQGLSEAELQGQQMENQYRMARASGVQALGSEAIRSRQYAEQLNTQAKATTQLGLQSILESVGNTGQQITNLQANTAQQQILASALRTADFKFGNVASMLKKAYQNKELTENEIFDIATNSTSEADAMDKINQTIKAKADKAKAQQSVKQ